VEILRLTEIQSVWKESSKQNIILNDWAEIEKITYGRYPCVYFSHRIKEKQEIAGEFCDREFGGFHVRDQAVGRSIMLKYALEEYVVLFCTKFTWL
jgi:hypothetical protein